MNGHVSKFAALWIGTASICICEQNALKVVEFEYAEGPETLMNSAVDLSRQVFHGAGEPRRTSTTQRDPVLARPPQSFACDPHVTAMEATPVSKNEPKLSLTLRIYDYAAVTQDTLAQAERAITRLLDEAGVHVRILRCSSPVERQSPAECRELLGAADLVVRIMPGAGPGSKRQLGVSIGATMATVYYQRVVEFSAEQPASERVATGEILGYGTAHEIGHLLLQSAGHSPAGIMRADWGTEELKLIWGGRLHFTAAQAEAMEVQVRQRLQRNDVGWTGPTVSQKKME